MEEVMKALRHHSTLWGSAFAPPQEHEMAWEQQAVLLCLIPQSVRGYRGSCRVLLFESFHPRCYERYSRLLQPFGGCSHTRTSTGRCGKGGFETVAGT